MEEGAATLGELLGNVASMVQRVRAVEESTGTSPALSGCILRGGRSGVGGGGGGRGKDRLGLSSMGMDMGGMGGMRGMGGMGGMGSGGMGSMGGGGMGGAGRGGGTMAVDDEDDLELQQAMIESIHG